MTPSHVDQQDCLNLLMQYLADLIGSKRKTVADARHLTRSRTLISHDSCAFDQYALTEEELVSMSISC